MYKAVLYYTCNTHPFDIERACRVQLARAIGDCQLVSVSREPIDFGEWNIVVNRPRSPETMHRQILVGLDHLDADVVFLCESDVLYHPSHFEIEPEQSDVFYYNTNLWRVRYPDGHAVWTDDLQQVSGICADRDLLLGYYSRRVREISSGGFNRHYEPQEKTGCVSANWLSTYPNLDIRHNGTLTKSKWRPSEFRNQRYARGWKETDHVDGWGQLEGQLLQLLEELSWDVRAKSL